MSKKFIYAGPSWAAMSYDTPEGDPSTSTNLLELWGLSDIAINVSKPGSNFIVQLKRIAQLNSNLPIIYVSCETLSIFDGETYLKPGFDVWNFRQDINIRDMKALKELNNPVAVIGAHTDITESDVTVIDSSWQNFLCRIAGLPEQYNWGADVLHRHYTHCDFLGIKEEIVDKISDQFSVWDKLEQKKLFCYVHPTTLANQLYAEYTEDKVKEFLNL